MIAFVDGPVITGTGSILEHATVVVENDKIVKVAIGDTNIPPKATKIPMNGMTLLPGLIDSHVHLCIDGSPDPLSTTLQESDTITTLKAARFARQTLMAGVTTIRDMGGRNGIDLDEETVALMVERQVPLVPTVSALYHIATKGVESGIPEYAVKKTLAVKPHHLESIRLAREAGVLIAMGTDAGTPFNLHGDNPNEIKLLVEWCGFSPLEAIEAATRVAAKALALENQIGTIEEGKLADLVLVKGDPLDDIGLLCNPENIYLVMQGGNLVKGAAN